MMRRVRSCGALIAKSEKNGLTLQRNELRGLPISFPSFDGVNVKTRFLHAGASEPHHLLRIQARDFDDEGNLHFDFDFNEAFLEDRLARAFMSAYVRTLDAFIEDSGQTEDDFLFDILESVSGKPVPDTIWEPMTRRHAAGPRDGRWIGAGTSKTPKTRTRLSRHHPLLALSRLFSGSSHAGRAL